MCRAPISSSRCCVVRSARSTVSGKPELVVEGAVRGHGAAVRLEHLGEDVLGAGLALRAGQGEHPDPTGPQLTQRRAGPGPAQGRQDVVDQHAGEPRVARRQHGRRTGVDRGPRVVVPVHPLARHGHEQTAPLGDPAVHEGGGVDGARRRRAPRCRRPRRRSRAGTARSSRRSAPRAARSGRRRGARCPRPPGRSRAPCPRRRRCRPPGPATRPAGSRPAGRPTSCTAARSDSGTASAPRRSASRIAAGSSLRGLSSVTTSTSASRAAISPIRGRLPASRSPPGADHDDQRAGRQRAQRAQGGRDGVRLVGVVHDREEVLSGVHLLQAAGHPAGRTHRVGERGRVETGLAETGERAQGVGHVEVPGQRHPGAKGHAARRVHGERRPGGLEVDVARPPVGGAALGRERPHRDPPPRRPGGGRAASSTLTSARRARSGVNSEAFAAKYSSTSAWKSRWSRPRLVKQATSKTTPSTRPITRAWLLTSIAHATTPRSAMTAKSACRSGASGVVREVSTSVPLTRVPTVPTTAAGTPPSVSAPSARRVVVVLPWVPVTATSRIRCGGVAVDPGGEPAEDGPRPLHHQHRHPHPGPVPGRFAQDQTGRVGEHRDGAQRHRVGCVRRTVRARPRGGDVEVPGPDAQRAQRHAGERAGRVSVHLDRVAPGPLAQPGDDVRERRLHRPVGAQRDRVGHAAEGTGPGHHSMTGVGDAEPVGATAYFCSR